MHSTVLHGVYDTCGILCTAYYRTCHMQVLYRTTYHVLDDGNLTLVGVVQVNRQGMTCTVQTTRELASVLSDHVLTRVVNVGCQHTMYAFIALLIDLLNKLDHVFG